MADEPGANLGEVTSRKKKAGFGTYVIIGVIALIVILGVSLFTGGNNGETPGNGASPGTNTNTPVTIPQLKSSLDSLNAKVDGFSGRLANLETQMAGLVAPQVTQADINSLQASINSLSTGLETLEANITDFEYEPVGGLNYYLFTEDGDAHLYVLSDRDGAFIAQVTVAFEDSILLNGTNANLALQDFYSQPWAKDGDYTPIISYNPTGNGTWEYTSVTFYSNVLDLEKGEEEEYWIDLDDLDKLDEEIDGIWIEVYPALETRSSGGLFN